MVEGRTKPHIVLRPCNPPKCATPRKLWYIFTSRSCAVAWCSRPTLASAIEVTRRMYYEEGDWFG